MMGMPMFLRRLLRSVTTLQAFQFATGNLLGLGPSPTHLPDVTDTVVNGNGTCEDWTSWIPPETNPAIVLQAICFDYADVEQNFIAMMETNSQFSRDNLYLLCLDTQSVELFRAMKIHCVFVGDIRGHEYQSIFKLRVTVIACLVGAGFDVIASDADALWVDDPMKDLDSPLHNKSSIVASRGHYPARLWRQWGSTMCMGFVLFRASGIGMRAWQQTMLRIVREVGDDQIALNNAAGVLGVVWDTESDMRFKRSQGEGRGMVRELNTTMGADFTVTLLPHSKYTRNCSFSPISQLTVVAHCFAPMNGGAKASWMRENNLWYVDSHGR